MAIRCIFECDCGEAATVKYAGDWMCERCRKLQRESREVKERYARGDRVPEKGKYVAKGRTTQNFQKFIEDMKPSTLIPNAMSRLETMLKSVDNPQAPGVEPTSAA